MNTSFKLLPNEVLEKIYYNYIPLYMLNMNKVHIQLLHDEHYLYLSEKLIDFNIDYMFAIRIPPLIIR